MAEKVVASDPSIGYMTKESRTPRRASGTFVPPVEGHTPRRSPRLLAKRLREQVEEDGPVTISTPVREAVRKCARGESSLQTFVKELEEYGHLKSCSVKAARGNKVTSYVVASRSTMIDNECIGPHDGVRLIVSEDGQYKFMVYEHLLKEGAVGTSTRRSEIVPLLEQMNDSSWVVCPRIADYSQYRSAIGYDINRVKSNCWPPNTARDCECAIWYRKEKPSDAGMCDRCKRLKWQLVARKKSHDDLSPSVRLKRQSALSNYPFQYLSPHSKKIKVNHLRQSLADLRRKASSKASVIDRQCMTDLQNGEISEVVRTIHRTEQGQQQLRQIFSEADQSGEGRGGLLKEIWDRDVTDMEQFFNDQKTNVTGRTSNKWSTITIRLALAIYSRSPAAFRAVRSLGILQLPCDKTVQRFMHRHNTSCGIDEESLLLNAQRYDSFKSERQNEGQPPPLGVGVLIWDEVKVQSRVIWNSANSAIMGFAMTSDDFSSLHDIYQDLDEEEHCHKTSYVVQFMWRDLSSNFDVIGPYFTISSTMETKYLHSLVTRTMLAFTRFGFGVKALLSDGASSNLSLMKLLCGYNDDSQKLTPWFKSPFSGEKVFVIVCPSHQLKNMIAALYSSRTDGTKDFRINGVNFGWDTIVRVYESDLYRAQHGISRRVPGLKYAHVVRDNWTRLNVLPAKIMQQPYMLSAIREMADKNDFSQDHTATAEYLEACNSIFERGILSHKK